MQARANYRLSDAIEQGIVIDELSGAATAWAFLEAYEIPRETILRVLSTAARRRSTDNPSRAGIEGCRSNS
jgi:hypothetical protein